MKFIPDRGIFFIHIPKNAGKSIHRALEGQGVSFAPFAADLGVEEAEARRLALSERRPDDTSDRHDASFDLPPFGAVHPAHLPLFVLAEKCPATFKALAEASHSFAMTRDPRGRFFSALMQRMKEFGDAGAIRADDKPVRDEAARVCDWLASRDRFADLEYVHFIRQSDFVSLHGKRVLKRVFPVNRSDLLSEWLLTETGLTAEVPMSHARRQPKRWARAVQPAARFAARRLMPHAVKKAIYPYWTGSALFDNAAGSYDKVSLGDDVEGFIKDFYAVDAALHQEAQLQAAQADAKCQKAG
ncbi:hypothetical protein [Alloyangia pacifica]|uniref:hypothetical protein n=1 Tax=Alloyangia pacifica TaxID=311180 RepID=UPI001CD30D7C|nr:hypothetical protein [Alloyangia pacifica]MCA0994790.1 hypothetical protein [Alloyangia pacifica]